MGYGADIDMAWFQNTGIRTHTDGIVLEVFMETFRNIDLSNRFPHVHGKGSEGKPLLPDMIDVIFSYENTLQIRCSALTVTQLTIQKRQCRKRWF
jgi:hypothetical protein